MGGAVVLPTSMLLLDDWNEVLMDNLRKFLRIVNITHFMKTWNEIRIKKSYHVVYYQLMCRYIHDLTLKRDLLITHSVLYIISCLSIVLTFFTNIC